MIRIFLLIYFIVYPVILFSQNSKTPMTREEYIRKYKNLAILEMKRSGIPASITLAQGCLESNNGNSRLAVEANNHFGIKCKSHWSGKRIYHTDDAPDECFRKYDSAEESYLDHTDFLITSPRYSQLFALHPTDYREWAHGLKRAGYATDPTYAERLIKIIEDSRLYIYDQVNSDMELATIERERHRAPKHPASALTVKTGRPVELRNGLKSVVVQQGDTFESLSKELGMSDWELYSYNDYRKGYQPRASEILYIEYKPRKADRKHLVHKVDKGDTMHFIAQRYGIKLKPLYARNRMKQGEEPQPGETIYLRNKKPRPGKQEVTMPAE
ncbi:MAG: glucosaminidase domain-containing protein [Prolixibacteraceae bacterium]|jgi:LysM repeat protein|nr:glucosaminidase domain-containing protein [Prolixibacteraceae bacterium]